jgi:hypothetical protein
MGLILIATMGCFVGSMTNPQWQIGFLFGLMAVPIVAFMRLRTFRNEICEGKISFRRAFVYVVMMMAYSCVLLAAATFVYFTFFDKGLFMNTLQQNIALPEVRESFKQAGMNPKELEEQLKAIAQSRPIDFALTVFSEGLITSCVLAAILALLGKRKEKNV